MSWRDIHVGKEGDRLRIGGVDVWRAEWRWVDAKTIPLPHPFDSRSIHSFMVCECGPPRRPVRFAAAQFPEGLWAFYVPDGVDANN